MIRLIAIDLDSTFVVPHKGVPQSAWEAIDRAKSAGVQLAVCTGRPYGGFGLEWAIQMEPEGIHAFANGSLMTQGAQIVDHTPLSQATHRAMVEASRRRELAFYVTGASGVLYAENPPPRLNRYAEVMGVEYQQCDLLALREPSVGGAYVLSATTWNQIRGEMSQIPGLDWLEYTTEDNTVVAVADPLGINKASALRWMARHYGFGLHQICMVGDSKNDYHAIKEAGLGIAMGNAEPEIKSVADTVVEHVENGGFAQAVELALAHT